MKKVEIHALTYLSLNSQQLQSGSVQAVVRQSYGMSSSHQTFVISLFIAKPTKGLKAFSVLF